MAKDKQIDLMKALISDRRAASDARSRKMGVDIQVKERLVVDLGAAESSVLSLVNHLAAEIKGELEGSTLAVSQATRDRRQRAQSTPQEGRYPGGYQPNPSGRYGHDSGYLADNIKTSLEGGNTAFASLPKNRQKAAFVIRRVSKAANLEGDGAKKAMSKGLGELLKASIKKVRGR